MKMNDKKNIDRLFQEKFKDFDITPSDTVWEKIKAHQEKDRKRLFIIPLWYRIAGVAALIAVLFSLGTVFFQDNTTIKENKIVTNGEDSEKKSIPAKDIIPPPSTPKTNIVEKLPEETTSTTDIVDVHPRKVDKKQTTKKNSTHKTQLTSNSSTANQLAIPNIKIQQQRNEVTSKTQSKEAIAITNTSTPNTKTTTPSAVSTNSVADTNSNRLNKNQNADLDPHYTSPNTTRKTEIANTSTPEKQQPDKESNIPPDTSKKSIFEAIQEKEDIAISEIDTEHPNKKWSVAPNVAPVFYSSFGDGSSIDNQLADNTKQGQINLSYGIQVAYNINKKWSIRSGVNKVDVAYNTEDVGFGISSVTNNFTDNRRNINPSRNIIISDFNTRPSPASDVNRGSLIKSLNPGILNHSLGYIEVPVELKYALTTTKLGIHMIGGVSTLFLEEDTASVIAGSFKNSDILRDDTVNDLSFSGNIGIGIDYKLTDQFLINMEPIFKYQFNGFKNSAENFRPYYFGVYTGVSFKF